MIHLPFESQLDTLHPFTLYCDLLLYGWAGVGALPYTLSGFGGTGGKVSN